MYKSNQQPSLPHFPLHISTFLDQDARKAQNSGSVLPDPLQSSTSELKNLTMLRYLGFSWAPHYSFLIPLLVCFKCQVGTDQVQSTNPEKKCTYAILTWLASTSGQLNGTSGLYNTFFLRTWTKLLCSCWSWDWVLFRLDDQLVVLMLHWMGGEGGFITSHSICTCITPTLWKLQSSFHQPCN